MLAEGAELGVGHRAGVVEGLVVPDEIGAGAGPGRLVLVPVRGEPRDRRRPLPARVVELAVEHRRLRPPTGRPPRGSRRRRPPAPPRPGRRCGDASGHRSESMRPTRTRDRASRRGHDRIASSNPRRGASCHNRRSGPPPEDVEDRAPAATPQLPSMGFPCHRAPAGRGRGRPRDILDFRPSDPGVERFQTSVQPLQVLLHLPHLLLEVLQPIGQRGLLRRDKGGPCDLGRIGRCG